MPFPPPFVPVIVPSSVTVIDDFIILTTGEKKITLINCSNREQK